jgi:hypothetical protein
MLEGPIEKVFPPGGWITIEQFVVAVPAAPPFTSITWAVKGNVPATVGVPLITPVEGFNVNSSGNNPEKMENVYGGTPPAAISEVENGTPTWPVAATHVKLRGAGRAAKKKLPPTLEFGPRVALTTSVIENGEVAVAAPFRDPLKAPVNGPKVPTMVPEPKGTFVLSKYVEKVTFPAPSTMPPACKLPPTTLGLKFTSVHLTVRVPPALPVRML